MSSTESTEPKTKERLAPPLPEGLHGTRDPLAKLCAKYGMTREHGAAVLQATVFSALESVEQAVAAAIMCNELELNPFRREVHAFNNKGKVCLAVGVDGWIVLAHRSRKVVHYEWSVDDWREDTLAHKYGERTGNMPHSCTCRVYFVDRERPFEYTVYLDEEFMPTEPWVNRTSVQMRNRSFARALRYGLGLTGVVDEEERAIIEADNRDIEGATRERRATRDEVFANLEQALKAMDPKKPAVLPEPSTRSAAEVVEEATGASREREKVQVAVTPKGPKGVVRGESERDQEAEARLAVLRGEVKRAAPEPEPDPAADMDPEELWRQTNGALGTPPKDAGTAEEADSKDAGPKPAPSGSSSAQFWGDDHRGDPES